MAIISNMSIWFLLVVLCSWVIVGYCQGGGDLPCVQSLMPCQPYLKGAVAPPASCCVPLKQIVATEVQCLCAVFNNQAIMKSLNVTQADALNLVKSCGSSADTSLCNTAATPPSPPSTPSASSNNTLNEDAYVSEFMNIEEVVDEVSNVEDVETIVVDKAMIDAISEAIPKTFLTQQ
ncbi:hypothetical protein BUALT_Bualt02G0085200 [Buddleja alternifolia]|uniref:Bifunctional inhibitor/plant lipid transfer protein/seed storage helical domain-containing protein n=1 Tax=Buddleja alternifolia TaxID=168488 RepID=A0AAV6Y056_9LAMI|nr:hypothetical protein BUALT_Bualt02G0085200 [Buddleja alternifolia]